MYLPKSDTMIVDSFSDSLDKDSVYSDVKKRDKQQIWAATREYLTFYLMFFTKMINW